MSCHPLIDALLELDGAAAVILQRSGSTREKQRLRDALSDMHVVANEVAVNAVAQGHGELTAAVFEEVVKRAREAGLPYTELAAAFHRAQGSE